MFGCRKRTTNLRRFFSKGPVKFISAGKHEISTMDSGSSSNDPSSLHNYAQRCSPSASVGTSGGLVAKRSLYTRFQIWWRRVNSVEPVVQEEFKKCLKNLDMEEKSIESQRKYDELQLGVEASSDGSFFVGDDTQIMRLVRGIGIASCGWGITFVYPSAVLVASLTLSTVLLGVFGFGIAMFEPQLYGAFWRRRIVSTVQCNVAKVACKIKRVVAYNLITPDWVKWIAMGFFASAVLLVMRRFIRRIVDSRRVNYADRTYEGTISVIKANARKYGASDLAFVVETIAAFVTLVLGTVIGISDSYRVYNVLKRGVHWLEMGVMGIFAASGLWSVGDGDGDALLESVADVKKALLKTDDVTKSVEKMKNDEDSLEVGVVVEEINSQTKRWSFERKLSVIIGLVAVLSCVGGYILWKRTKVVRREANGRVINVYFDDERQKWVFWYQQGVYECYDDLTDEEFPVDRIVLWSGEHSRQLPEWARKKVRYIAGKDERVKVPETRCFEKVLSMYRSKANGNKKGWMAYDDSGSAINFNDHDVLMFSSQDDYDDWYDTTFRSAPNRVFIGDDRDAPAYGKNGHAVGEHKISTIGHRRPKCVKKVCGGVKDGCLDFHFLPPCVDQKCDGACGKYHKKQPHFRMKALMKESKGSVINQTEDMHKDKHVRIEVTFADGWLQKCYAFMMNGCLWTVAHVFTRTSGSSDLKTQEIVSLQILGDDFEYKTNKKIWIVNTQYDVAVIKCVGALMKAGKRPLQNLKLGKPDPDGSAVTLWMNAKHHLNGVGRCEGTRFVHSCPTDSGDCGGSVINSVGKVIAIHNIGDGKTQGIPNNEAVLLTSGLVEAMVVSVQQLTGEPIIRTDFTQAQASL